MEKTITQLFTERDDAEEAIRQMISPFAALVVEAYYGHQDRDFTGFDTLEISGDMIHGTYTSYCGGDREESTIKFPVSLFEEGVWYHNILRFKIERDQERAEAAKAKELKREQETRERELKQLAELLDKYATK